VPSTSAKTYTTLIISAALLLPDHLRDNDQPGGQGTGQCSGIRSAVALTVLVGVFVLLLMRCGLMLASDPPILEPFNSQAWIDNDTGVVHRPILHVPTGW
jgi:hypothetical protein